MAETSTPVDFGTAVDALKRELQKHIGDSVREFAFATGMSPTSIRVDMIDVTTVGERHKRYVVGDIRVGFGDY